MRLLISVLAASWLVSGCAGNAPRDEDPGAESPDTRTGLCSDGTPAPCPTPRD